MQPAWLSPALVSITAEADVAPHLLFSDVIEGLSDEVRVERLINGHIQTQAAFVWGEAQTAAGGRISFAPTLVQLGIAFPFDGTGALTPEIEAEMLADYLAGLSTRQEQIKASAKLVVKELVIAKLMYGATRDEDAQNSAKTHYINAMVGLKSLKKQLSQIRRAYIAQTTEPMV